jgi:hypothetical protein
MFKNESIARPREDEKKTSPRTVIPDFEKPIIIRPKSTTDLRRLQHKAIHQQGDRQSRAPPQLALRVEQDLEVKAQRDGVNDDKEFESWFDDMQPNLEAATLEKYTYIPVEITLTVERIAPYCKQDYIHAMLSCHKHHLCCLHWTD